MPVVLLVRSTFAYSDQAMPVGPSPTSASDRLQRQVQVMAPSSIQVLYLTHILVVRLGVAVPNRRRQE